MIKTKEKEASEIFKPGSGSRVAIRLYCHGLGDCFLLSFKGSEERRPFYVLIDCGVIQGTDRAKEKMVLIAEDIKKACDGRLDVVIATHEHWDHIFGFMQAKGIFDTIEVGTVWLPWTEDKSDPLAARIRETRLKAQDAINLAMRKLDENMKLGVSRILEYFGAKNGDKTESAMEWLKEKGSIVKYLRPGQVLKDLVPQVGFFVLGPPRDEKWLRNISTGKNDVYHLSAYSAAVSGFYGALVDDKDELANPFDRKYGSQLIETDEYLKKSYYDKDEDYRRIDNDWLNTVGTLAIQLDSHTNNTSLVIAIHLEENDEYLLFPGDAQTGNWLSWYDVDFNGIGAEEILEKTVFYKVGHHGSHNATMSNNGLEKMCHPELAAFIPVDEDVAHNTKNWTKMPFRPLLDRLEEKTKTGGMIQADIADRIINRSKTFFKTGPVDRVVNRPVYVTYER